MYSMFNSVHNSTNYYRYVRDHIKELPAFLVSDNEIDVVSLLLIKPDLEKGPWIAGGAPLNWWNNTPLHSQTDIDVWFKNKEQYDNLYNYLKSFADIDVVYESDNASTFLLSYNNKHRKIQLIKKSFSNTPSEVISKFDITVCQILTDGTTYILGSTTAADIRSKTLRMNTPLHPEAIKRAAKYMCYGYRPEPELFEELVNNPIQVNEFNISGDY